MKRFVLVLCVSAMYPVQPAAAQSRGPYTYTAGELTAKRVGRLRSGVRMSPIRALLLKPVKKISWDETPFSEVTDWVKAQSTEHGKVNVIVKWRALEIESIDRETPITLEMEDTNVASVLDEVLDQLSDLDPVTYVGIRNRLRISTKSDLDRKLFVRVYNIDDIFFEVQNFRGSPQIDLNQQQRGGGGGGGGGEVARPTCNPSSGSPAEAAATKTTTRTMTKKMKNEAKRLWSGCVPSSSPIPGRRMVGWGPWRYSTSSSPSEIRYQFTKRSGDRSI